MMGPRLLLGVLALSLGAACQSEPQPPAPVVTAAAASSAPSGSPSHAPTAAVKPTPSSWPGKPEDYLAAIERVAEAYTKHADCSALASALPALRRDTRTSLAAKPALLRAVRKSAAHRKRMRVAMTTIMNRAMACRTHEHTPGREQNSKP